eukprot:CAMPEP_0116055984 /NCGR_PEP_ID=MMETSP0322-20121206/3745_1 /TAXON_ID=163516 /ORGANISM="Leptocylindrus danicus var. apora, Strain B651" /LENGTH=43 /DNA_ID= /DNA_START= /DNA_END= /DNA_ORIENTATION=
MALLTVDRTVSLTETLLVLVKALLMVDQMVYQMMKSLVMKNVL